MNTKDVSSKRVLAFSVPPGELRPFEQKAFASLKEGLSLPGFRRGHVPDAVARQHISAERIFHEAVSLAVARKSSEALEAFAEEYVGRPAVEILEAAPGNALEFRITLEVLPNVDLAEWRKLRIRFSPKPVEEQEVEVALKRLSRSRMKLRAVLRPAAKGDIAEVDFSTKVDGVSVEGGAAKKQPIVLGEGGFVPGFEEAVVGMQAGEERNVRLLFPQDWPTRHLAGKEGEFAIVLVNVQERLLPELDDSFAQSLGRFKTVDELRASVREGLAAEHEEAEHRRVRTEAVDRLGERIADAAVPEALIHQETARMQEEMKSSVESSGISFDEYLARLGKKQEEFASDFRNGALKRVKAALVLRTLARQEGIEVLPEEVERRMQDIARSLGEAGQGTGRIDSHDLRRYTENSLRNEKTMELLEQVVTGREISETTNPSS